MNNNTHEYKVSSMNHQEAVDMDSSTIQQNGDKKSINDDEIIANNDAIHNGEVIDLQAEAENEVEPEVELNAAGKEKIENFYEQFQNRKNGQQYIQEQVIHESIDDKNKTREIKVDQLNGSIQMTEEERRNMNLVDRMRANKLKSDKQMQAQELIFDTQVEMVKHQAAAIERQSKAYWDAKSVNFAESLKTFAQDNMHLLEKARAENKQKVIIEIYEDTNRKLSELVNKQLPARLLNEIGMKICEVRDASIARIEQDVLANRYDLGPDNKE